MMSSEEVKKVPGGGGWMRLWFVLWFIAVALILYPIKNSILRACAILAVSGLWFGLLALCWDRRALRFTLLLLTATIAGFLLLPGGSVDPNTLRQRYVDSLVRYEGTKYVWGGENTLGIDCSGLVRKGLINAELREGLSSLNPRLVRQGLSLWWFDSSAQALGDEYRHKTRRLFTTPSINSLDHSRLRPGDFAVT